VNVLAAQHEHHQNRPEGARPTREAGLLLGGIVAAVAAAAFSGDVSDGGPVLCPFRKCTGAYCPGCGGTRAVARLLRGDLVGAWHQHPYVVLLAVQSVVFGGAWFTAPGQRLMRRFWLPVLVTNVAMITVIWMFRLAIGDIPGI